MPTPLPPLEIDGTIRPQPRDVPRLTWWAERGFVVGATSPGNPLPVRWYYAAVSAAFVPLLPVALGAQLARTTRPWVRYYMSLQRDAVIAVGTRHGCWYVEDHASAKPGSDRGRALRAVVLPALCAAADGAGIAIEAIALSDRLAQLYCDEVPGLLDQGGAAIRGRRLRREPRPVS